LTGSALRNTMSGDMPRGGATQMAGVAILFFVFGIVVGVLATQAFRATRTEADSLEPIPTAARSRVGQAIVMFVNANSLAPPIRTKEQESLGSPGGKITVKGTSPWKARARASLSPLLPRWPIANLIIDAAAELAQLRQSIPHAREAGVTGDRLAECSTSVRAATEALAQRATKVASLAAMNVTSETLERLVAVQEQRVERIYDVAHDALEGLAQLAASDQDAHEMKLAEERLRRFAAVAKEEAKLSSSEIAHRPGPEHVER